MWLLSTELPFIAPDRVLLQPLIRCAQGHVWPSAYLLGYEGQILSAETLDIIEGRFSASASSTQAFAGPAIVVIVEARRIARAGLPVGHHLGT